MRTAQLLLLARGAAALKSDANTRGLQVSVPLYLVGVGLVTFWVYRRRKRQAAALRAEHGECNDDLASHYLANREFGVFVTVMTLFASLFSGYTVFGVPDEAYAKGWYALRWVVATLQIAFWHIVTGPRLRKCSVARNHQSPVDFITDRFGSQLLRYTVVALQLFPAWLYLTAQLVSLKNTFNVALFNLPRDDPTGTVVIALLIVVLEWVGGLASVAWTDAVQGLLMTVGFVVLPIVVTAQWGGWEGLDPQTYPQPSFYQVPDTDTQFLFWNFTINLG